MNLKSSGTRRPADESFAPDVRIVDAHHHLYPDPGGLYGSYSVDDFSEDTATVPFSQSIYVECGQRYRTVGPAHLRPVGETEWVADIADRASIAGVIGFADLTSPAVEETLAAHQEAGEDRFCGIRHRMAWDPDEAFQRSHVATRPRLASEPAFRRGFSELAQSGLVFDAFVYFHQLSDVIELAQNFPEVRIVVNHLGGHLGTRGYQDESDRVSVKWRELMKIAASRPNILVKIGGLGSPRVGRLRDTPANAEHIDAAWRSDVRWVIEQFGPARCMLESNFPVDRSSFSYFDCWAAYDRITSDLSPSERGDLFHSTARRVYSLPLKGQSGVST